MMTDSRPSAASLGKIGKRILALLPVAYLIGIVALAFVSPLPHDPTRPDMTAVLERPSSKYWLGTDEFGVDVFSRTIVAARIDIPISVAAVGLSAVLGVPIGLLVTIKSRLSNLIMRALDISETFPLFLLALTIVALVGPSTANVVVIIGVVMMPRFIRLVRSQGLSLREKRFVEAANAIGASRSRILFRHMLPNMTGVILAQSALGVSNAILIIAGMSFLGIGIEVGAASWGTMVRIGSQNMLAGQWWPAFPPGVAIFFAVASFNQLADRARHRSGV
jgi:peptide/nickel transport system permease protein